MMKVILSKRTAEELVKPELRDDDMAHYHFEVHPLNVDDMLDDDKFLDEVDDLDEVNEHIFARIQYLYPRRPPMTDAKGVRHDDFLTLEEFLFANRGWGYMPESSFKEITYTDKMTGAVTGVTRTLHSELHLRPQFVTTAKLFDTEDKAIRDGGLDDTKLATGLSVLVNGNPWRDYGRKLAISRAVQQHVQRSVGRGVRVKHVFGKVVGSERVYVVPIGA